MKRLRIFILLIVSPILLLAPKYLVNACGFRVAPGEYRFWLLQPDLTQERELTPFFFASTYFYKGDEKAGAETYPQKNIEEWLELVRSEEKKKRPGEVRVRKSDIDILLYSTTPDLFFGKSDSLAKVNSFMRYLLLDENSTDFRYIQLSKKVEQLAANPDPWEEGLIPHANIGRIIDEAQTLYRQAGSDFVKMRTAFQLMRLYSFNGNVAALCRVYDERIAPVRSDSWIKSAALYQKALRGELPNSDRLLAQVFDRGDYNKSYCLMHLRSAKVDSLVRTTSNTHERVVLQAMKVFNFPGRTLADIQNIYKSEPGYREIPFLFLREINKTEDWLETGQVTGFKPAVHDATYGWQWGETYRRYNQANFQADRAYASQLNDFLLRVANDGRAAQPALLYLFSAHLSMLLGDNVNAGKRLQAAGAFAGLPRNVKSQIAINRFLLSLDIRKELDDSLQAKLLELLREPAVRLGMYDADIMKDQLILYTARKMIRWGDKARGLMLLSRTRRALGELPISEYKDVYQEIAETAEPSDYDKMIKILDRGQKTAFERFVTTGRFGSPMEYYSYYDLSDYKLMWDRNRLLDGKASWYLRKNNLEAAAQTLRRIPDSFWRHHPFKEFTGGNPFYLDINKTGHYRGKTEVDYNKRTIVEKMLVLKALAQNDPASRAESHFQLANAWYNMTYRGNNWLMVKSWWSVNELDKDYPAIERTAFNDFYYGCDRAKELYLLAMHETHDQKLATLCCFMAGLCNDHRKYYLSLVANPMLQSRMLPGGNLVHSKNPYLAYLRDKGIDERNYKELVKECAIYIDYIRTFDKAL
jgi:hypothetical protein